MQRSLHFPSADHLRLRGYVPVLQDKAGELQALRCLAATRPQLFETLTPALHVVGPKKGQLSRDALKGHVRRIRESVGTRPVYLAFARADPAHLVELRGEKLTLAAAVHHYCRHFELAAIPVVSSSSAGTVRDAVFEAATVDGRGLAIRHPLIGTTSPTGASPAHAVRALLDEAGLPAEDVDLWLDLGFLDEDSEVSPSRIVRTVERMEQVAPWRRIVLTGSSMPPALSCVPEGTDGLLPRHEWRLWQALPSELRQRLDFGDYAVQHPSPPADGGASMRANIRYTVADGHFVVRGRGPYREEGAAQYVGLCSRIVNSGRFAGREFSWGDELIARCAADELAPGAQTMWRAVGTAHHLRVVSEQLQATA